MKASSEGAIQKYPCTCHSSGICWIVRHPAQKVPISYETEEKAKAALKALEGQANR